MKQFQFKQAVLLGKGKAGLNSLGKVYHLGVHEVSEEHQKDPSFEFYSKAGLIVPFVKKDQEELKPASSAAAKQSAEVAKSQMAPDSEVGGDAESSDEADASEEAEDKPHGKRRRK